MSLLKKLSIGSALVAAALAFTACSGDDGKSGINGADGISGVDGKDGKDGIDGKDGKDAKEINVDSLAQVIREDISSKFMDSLSKKPFVDTIYNELFDNTLGDKWMDSVRNSLIDSLKNADYDSLYKKLYDSVYNDIYTQHAARSLAATIVNKKDDIYGAFANQYPTMYKDFKSSDGNKIFVPLTLAVQNVCENDPKIQCRWKKVTVKAWIEGVSDTGSVTGNINSKTTENLGPSLKFNSKYLLGLTTPKQEQIQVRAYAEENDHEILFFSESIPTTIHPMQINGAEYEGVKNRDWWDGVWVTPAMDSMETIINQVAEKLPEGVLKVYQQYEEDESIALSGKRVVEAIFNVLQKRKIKYVENDGAGSTGQKINYPIEVLRSKQAICNEFSFLFASVLEAIGFDVYLIKIPNHMFVAWSTERDGNTIDCIETTLIGNSDATFNDANKKGNETFNEQSLSENFSNGKAQIIKLPDVRKAGITPNDIP